MAKLLRTLGPKILQHSRWMVEPTHFMQAGDAARQTQRALSSQSLGVGSGGRVGDISIREPREDMPYHVKGLSHIAIAVPDLSNAAEHYRSAFGAQVSQPVEKSDQGVTVVFVKMPNVCIELLHPLGENSTVTKFLQRNPKGGIHHICLAVDDITSAAEYLNSEVGVRTVGSSTPTLGAEGKQILFLNPKDNHGVLIELQEANERASTKSEVPQAING